MTLNDLATADILLDYTGGTVALLRPLTKLGGQWLHDHVCSEPWQWMGPALACEPRLVEQVLRGAEDDGLKVAA